VSTYPEGTNAETTTYGYDANGNTTSVTDGLGHTTSYSSDARNRLTSVTEPTGGGTTTYTYDDASRLMSVTDPKNNVTSYGYDAANRVTSETDPLNHTTTYFYDLVGNMTKKTDRDGRVTEYTYDADNRLATVTWDNPGGGNPLNVITTTYDAAGREAKISDAYSSYTYSYDNANRLTSVDNAGTPNVPHVVLTNGYDAAGNRTSLSDSLGGVNSYTYDAWNELTGLAQSGTGVSGKGVTFSYDGAGRLTGLSRFSNASLNGTGAVLSTTYTYDGADRLTGITHALPNATVVASYAYTLDDADRLTSEARTWTNPGGGTSTDTLGYTYTDNNQLTGVTHTNTSFANESFSYDSNGNRNMTGYSTGPGNELTSDGTYNYTYDNEGNEVTKTAIATGNETIYAYDFRNRLAEVDQVVGGVRSVVVQYTYDALNRRIGVSEGGATTWTVYDGTSARPLIDFNGSGIVAARYLNAPSPVGVDELLARDTPSGGVAWYLADRLESVGDVVSNSGAVIDHVDYSAYGQVLDESSPSNGDRMTGFAGLKRGTVTGLNEAVNRSQDPVTGRWTSPDPKGFAAGDANLDRYAVNSPTNLLDPSGETPNQQDTMGFGMLIFFATQIDQKYPNASLRMKAFYLSQFLGYKYIYTCNNGWVDLHHFLWSALPSFGPDSAFWTYYLGGYGVELIQSIPAILIPIMQSLWPNISLQPGNGFVGGGASAWSFEDLPSDYLGTQFGVFMQNNSQLSLPDALNQFFGPMNPVFLRPLIPGLNKLPTDENDWQQQWLQNQNTAQPPC
jgi:RHS repeat-associated protein